MSLVFSSSIKDKIPKVCLKYDENSKQYNIIYNLNFH